MILLLLSVVVALSALGLIASALGLDFLAPEEIRALTGVLFVACWAWVVLWGLGLVVGGLPVLRLRRRRLGGILLSQAAALTRLGLSLRRGLAACADKLGGASREDALEVRSALDQGALLGDAMGRVPVRKRGLSLLRVRPGLVSPAEAETLRVGEMSGQLGHAVELALAERRRRGEGQTWALVAACYTGFLLVFIGAIASCAVIFVMPRSRRMFDEFGLRLPAVTRQLHEFGPAVWGPMAAATLALVLLGLCVSWRLRPAVRAESSLRNALRRLASWAPYHLGPLRRLAVAEFVRDLAMLLRVGTPAHRALDVIGQGTLTPWLRDRVCEAARLCRQGVGLGDALDQAGVDHRVAWFGRALGRGGEACQALTRLADDYEVRTAWSSSLLIRFAMPMVIVLIGMAVAVFVIGMYMPIIKLTGAM